MDTQYKDYEVLSNLQKKISFLFQDLMREKNSYKQNSENLNIKLEQLSAEAEILKKENKALREIYEEIKVIIYVGVRLFRNADFSGLNLKREHEIEMENLRKKILDTDRKLDNFESSCSKVEVGNSLGQVEKTPRLNIKRYAMNEAEIQKEYEAIKELSFSTQFFNNDEPGENKQEKQYVLSRSNAESVLKNTCERKPDNTCLSIKKAEDSAVLRESEILYLDYVDDSPWNKSPVFKDFVSRRQEGLPAKVEPDEIQATCPPVKLINEKFVGKSTNFIISPWKMSKHITESSPIKECVTPKRGRKQLEICSPKRSPKAQLKKSNSREAEISVAGVRKLTQTLLNIECYKKIGLEDWKNCENRENENFVVPNDDRKCERTVIVDPEEDDFIIESPKKKDLLPEDIKSRSKNENALKDVQLITPPETSEADLDETYISSSIIRKCNLPKRHCLEKVTEEQTPLKRPAREKSPEYDSVPFVYKREPVRKKAERMKLPGHACFECNKYYENALGDINTQDLKKILNKCSRHRDKNSPTHDETPPGYWKPYLTCSFRTPKKDND